MFYILDTPKYYERFTIYAVREKPQFLVTMDNRKTAVFQGKNHSCPQCGLRFSDQVQNRNFAVVVLVIRGLPMVLPQPT
jgi:hypothetical protein